MWRCSSSTARRFTARPANFLSFPTTADITAAHDEFGAPPSPSEKSPGLRRRRDSRSKAADDASNRVTEAVLEQAVEATRRRAEEAHETRRKVGPFASLSMSLPFAR